MGYTRGMILLIKMESTKERSSPLCNTRELIFIIYIHNTKNAEQALRIMRNRLKKIQKQFERKNRYNTFSMYLIKKNIDYYLWKNFKKASSKLPLVMIVDAYRAVFVINIYKYII